MQVRHYHTAVRWPLDETDGELTLSGRITDFRQARKETFERLVSDYVAKGFTVRRTTFFHSRLYGVQAMWRLTLPSDPEATVDVEIYPCYLRHEGDPERKTHQTRLRHYHVEWGDPHNYPESDIAFPSFREAYRYASEINRGLRLMAAEDHNQIKISREYFDASQGYADWLAVEDTGWETLTRITPCEDVWCMEELIADKAMQKHPDWTYRQAYAYAAERVRV